MKTTIHPPYFNEVTVTCSCGSTFVTGSTKDSIHVDICSACHPFFTGEMKYVDVQGRVEKFQAKQAKAKDYKATVKAKKQKSSKQVDTRSLKEMLTDLKAQQTSAKNSPAKN